MIEIGSLSKSFSDGTTRTAALVDVALRIPRGAFFTLLGPSGCGKSTLLRCIAGLEDPDAGEIAIEGETVYSGSIKIKVPINRRRIGMVFQSYAIWPHMTVFGNVAFPLAVSGKTNVTTRVMTALATVGLDALAERPATRLSGGQQQRVALARAIVAEPAILLLDEPLSNLDAGLREQMRGELRSVQRELGLTTVLVTHDQEEALSLSDEIALMRDGRVVEQGTPRKLYGEPESVFAAQFIGAANIVDGVARRSLDASTWVDCAFGALHTLSDGMTGPVTAIIRQENLRLHDRPPAGQGMQNCFPCRVMNLNFLGGAVDFTLELGPQGQTTVLHGRLPASAVPEHVGFVDVRPDDVRVIAR